MRSPQWTADLLRASWCRASSRGPFCRYPNTVLGLCRRCPAPAAHPHVLMSPAQHPALESKDARQIKLWGSSPGPLAGEVEHKGVAGPGHQGAAQAAGGAGVGQEQQEGLVVEEAHAGGHPHAVMVHLEHAAPGHPAVVRAVWLPRLRPDLPADGWFRLRRLAAGTGVLPGSKQGQGSEAWSSGSGSCKPSIMQCQITPERCAPCSAHVCMLRLVPV